MRIRRLKTRFVAAGAFLVAATAAGGLWSALKFAGLRTTVDETLQESRETIDRTAALGEFLEREDDALLLAITGELPKAREELGRQRTGFDATWSRLAGLLVHPDERSAAGTLRGHVDAYRAAGDRLLADARRPEALVQYHSSVNPALRLAVADCARIRELNFRSIEAAGLAARDAAARATVLVAAVSLVVLAVSAVVALRLARSVVVPIGELTESVEAVRRGDFDRRVPVKSSDELGRLAEGFNRMAGTLAEFRRSNLGEVMRAKETLEATLAALPDAVFVVDPDGRVVSTNPPARHIAAAGAAPGTGGADGVVVLPPDALPAVREVLREGRPFGGRAELERAVTLQIDGSPRKLLPVALPVPGFADGRCGAVAVLYDVTDFARLDELRTEVVAVASHELRTPLTTLRMNLMLMRESADELAPRQRDYLANALSGCSELEETIDELLDLTRIEAGQLRLTMDRVDLRTLVRQAVRPLQTRFDDAAISLRIAGPPEDRAPTVHGDAVRLRIAFSNILTNSLKYTPYGGSVNVEVSPLQNAEPGRPGILQITVTDSGTGVPEEFRERIFEKFFRVEHQRGGDRGGVRGAGIGLYLCRQIVEAHGGSVTCTAGEGGRGTRIAIRLPPETQQPAGASESAST